MNTKLSRSIEPQCTVPLPFLPAVIERTRDVKDVIRRDAFCWLAEKCTIRHLTINQRIQVGHSRVCGWATGLMFPGDWWTTGRMFPGETGGPWGQCSQGRLVDRGTSVPGGLVEHCASVPGRHCWTVGPIVQRDVGSRGLVDHGNVPGGDRWTVGHRCGPILCWWLQGMFSVLVLRSCSGYLDVE